MTTWTISTKASADSPNVSKSTSPNLSAAAGHLAAELRRIVTNLDPGRLPRFTVTIDGSIEAIMKVVADEHGKPDTATALDQIDRLEHAFCSATLTGTV